MTKQRTEVETLQEKICCGVLEKMNINWFITDDGTKCMPYIKGNSDSNMYRINNCPSCGTYIRDCQIETNLTQD